MKIKVEKEEYEELLERVERLEGQVETLREYTDHLLKTMREQLEDFFERKCQVVMIKRDKEQLVAKLRAQAMNNIFKEESK